MKYLKKIQEAINKFKEYSNNPPFAIICNANFFRLLANEVHELSVWDDSYIPRQFFINDLMVFQEKSFPDNYFLIVSKDTYKQKNEKYY